ncbi:hypothetical protein AB0I16_13915 [Streptomyces sp. NPDC050703]|uniref:hypothetical protein n=1 Tax=Streptomyces sp. NPDC050703 TaxID=3157218 RepID=UPI003418E168
MFEILTDLLDSLDNTPDFTPEAAHPASGGDVLFGHHGEIQNGSYVTVPDPGEVTAADGTDYLSPADKSAGVNPRPAPNPA